MAGTSIGGKRAAATNKERYGDTFYRKIGAEGGRVSSGGGFITGSNLARIAGRKGGQISKRRPSGQ